MTATCREACCSVTPRHTVSELFERGFRRNRAAPLPIEGAQLADVEGNAARFSIDVTEGKIAGVGFRATSCATLIAYCEFIAESVPGFRLEIARELTAANLVAAVPGVPALKRERAILAVAAFRATLALYLEIVETGEHCNESRLHLRHPAP
jgi:NifU-like protein involved in Fe-S cluster formation